MHRRLLLLGSLAPLLALNHCDAPPVPSLRFVDDSNEPASVADGGSPGTTTQQTAAAGTCTSDADCPGSACGDDAKCATAPSCARVHGGRTCGPTGNDDCCAMVTQPVGKGATAKIDKYLVTAGRMRAFIERFNGDIQSFVGSLGDKWKSEWSETDSLPSDIASANELLGPYGNKKSCNMGDETGHTYWTPADGAESSDLDQDTLDEKALNCVPWPLLQALCVSEGGHIATLAELRAGFTNNGATKYPWGNDGLQSPDAPDPNERLNMAYGYETSPLPATYRKRADGRPAGATFFISPPGRFSNGNNQMGLADSAGDLLEWTGDRRRQFVWKADFEHHAANAITFNFGNWWWESSVGSPWIWGTNQLFGNAGNGSQKNGYYSIGGRCAR